MLSQMLQDRFMSAGRGALAALALLLLIGGLFSPLGVSADAPESYLAGEVVIGWRPGEAAIPVTQRVEGALDTDRSDPQWLAAAAAVNTATGLKVLDAQPRFGYARLQVRPGREQTEVRRLQALQWVAYAELNYIARAADAGVFYPNDTYLGQQWNMRRVDAPQAWSVTRGSLSFVIAVVDTGVDRTHADLAGHLLPGRNYVQNGNPYPDDDSIDSHGTHVAGIIAATMDNATGVAGLASGVRVLPLKVLDWQGTGAYSDIATAIRYAADYGAQVINVSLGGGFDSQTLSEAVYYAQGRGALVVAAAGNCAQINLDCPIVNPDVFPAAYPGVLAVAASDHYDRWTSYSGYKPYIGLAAPGGTSGDSLLSTVRGGYGYLYGTSMAAPHVAAAAALVWSLSSAWTSTQVADLLKSTADKVGTNPFTGNGIPYANGRNDYFGYGRLNVGRALRWVLPPLLSTPQDANVFLIAQGGSQTRTLPVTNPSDQSVWWEATVIQGGEWLRVATPSGVTSFTAPSAVTFSVGASQGGGGPPPGQYYGVIRLRAIYPATVPALDIPVQLTVAPVLLRSRLPLTILNSRFAAWQDPFSPTILDGKALYLADEELVQESLPFPVRFYGGTYTSIWISDNGFALLGQPQTGANKAPAACLRTAEAPNGAIYANAANWDAALGGQTFVHRPDADTYVITWHEVRRQNGDAPQTFQLIFERGGAIRAAYRSLDLGALGVIGTEYYDGTVAEQVYCAGTGRAPAPGDTLHFDAVLPW